MSTPNAYSIITVNQVLQWLAKLILNIASDSAILTNPVRSTYHQADAELERENEIIKQAKNNPEYFAPIYTKYYDSIFLFINRRTDNLEVTADLTSKVFLVGLKNIKKYKNQGVPFSAWLYRIAINEVNLFFRQQKKLERTVNLDDNHIHSLMDQIEYSEIPIDPCVLIPLLLEQLDENEVQFIELRFFENYSFKEMGYLLGITEVNAKIKTYRVLKKLKKISESIRYN